MKHASIFILQIIFLMAASIFVSGCQRDTPALTPVNTAALTAPLETPTIVIAPVFTPTPQKNYEVLSPSLIRKDNTLFEISGRARPGYLQIFFKASAKELPESYSKGNLVEQLVFEPSTTPTLVLEFSGGGGGFGTDGSEFIVNQEFGYTVGTPLAPGQILLIVVSATFNQYTGLSTPVEFRLEIPVE